jgi:cysteine desulfurase family protein (TIGR01976 family)
MINQTEVRNRFPALRRQAEQAVPTIFFDNPGGTQISQSSLDRVTSYLEQNNANHGGAFATSQESDAILHEAHCAMADFYNATSPQEIIFGANMTTLTLHLSRSISRTWNPADKIVVTRLDHDANITPWMLAAQDRGCDVSWVDFHPEDGTLNLEDLEAALAGKPRLLAVGYASNSLGTINPIDRIVEMAHAAGCLVYVDSVQYAAHGPIDVQRIGCDFLVSSAYKFFGTHAGILYGRYDLLNELFAYKVRPASNSLPDKFETGTQNHEGIAGVLGAIEYLEWLGKTYGNEYAGKYNDRFSDRKLYLKQAMSAIQACEYDISRATLTALHEIPGLRIYGISDTRRLDERVPTFSFTLPGWQPRQVAAKLGEKHINVWDGNYYALAITERLGLEQSGGMVRVGPVHYNTPQEISRFKEELLGLASK